MFSRFFIDRPVFASVLSIVITLTGAVAVFNLPVAQYPRITPPSIIVSCSYPGASADVVAQSIAAPIEQMVNGVEDMIYMSSGSANDGSYALTVTFKSGIDLDAAQVLVQNRVKLALPLLPDVVRQAGFTIRKRNPDILLIVSLFSPSGQRDQLYLSNYSTISIKDELARVDGVGDISLFGQQDYSMRVWVDPDRLASLNLSASDVVNALRSENKQFAAGQLGQPPTDHDQPFEYPVGVLGRLSDPKQIEEVVLRTTNEGRKVRIRDVGRVVIGARNMDVSSKLDGQPCANIAVFQLPYANAIATAERVRAKMEDLKQDFPDGVDYSIAFDTTPFVKESIGEVFRTLAEAVVLVAIVVLVFLQNWRSTLIPLVAVPVAIIGTFAAMAAIGFSLNMLTLFGLVLAIGIVVDDAIVVVEAVEHHIEHGVAPREAAHLAMQQVSGPVIAVALVLSAVFLPCVFISGITGQFFKQFALTIAVSTILSAFNSLTLSPALAAILLRPRKPDTFEPLPWFVLAPLGAWLGHKFGARLSEPILAALPWHFSREVTGIVGELGPAVLGGLVAALAGLLLGKPLNVLFGGFFRLFNWSFRHGTNVYTGVVARALRGSILVLVIYVGLVGLTWWSFNHLPTGYIPNQDQGRLYAAIQLPDSASLERTQEVVDRVSQIAKDTPGVMHTLTVAGQSFVLSANGSNFGNIFITLDDFSSRRTADRSGEAIISRLSKEIAAKVPEAVVTVLGPPPVAGLGSTGGFKLIIEDRSGSNDIAKLQEITDALIDRSKPVKAAPNKGPVPVIDQLHKITDELIDGSKPVKAAPNKGPLPVEVKQDPSIAKVKGLFTVFKADSPQLYVDVNREQCRTMGVDPNDVFTALQVYLGSYYVNDVNLYGRTWQLVVQAEGEFRYDAQQVRLLKVRNNRGDMVPLGSLLTMRKKAGPILLMRYNMYPAAPVVGGTQPLVSSGEGIAAMQELAGRVLPQSMAYEWTEINFIQVDASKNIWNNLIFPLSVVFVFLVLAAQYESWALPLAVILVVPMCILGSLTGIFITHGDINIFTQIGLVVLVGLASKNAILIVEFAKHKRESGRSREEATLEACQLRLRPILMTSFAFILGVVPLMTGRGAGAEMRRSLGTAVFSGMLGVTLFGIFLTPVFFYVIEWVAESRRRTLGKFLAHILPLQTMRWLLGWAARVMRLRVGPALSAPRKTVATNGHVNLTHINGQPHVIIDGPLVEQFYADPQSALRNGNHDSEEVKSPPPHAEEQGGVSS